MENSELKIEQQRDGTKLFCKLSGWLDPNTSQDLIYDVDLKGIKTLTLDMAEVEYVFSSGIRALLLFQKVMDEAGGTMKLINVAKQVKTIFEDAGLGEMLDQKHK